MSIMLSSFCYVNKFLPLLLTRLPLRQLHRMFSLALFLIHKFGVNKHGLSCQGHIFI